MSHTPPATTAPWWKRWWRRLPPSRQDRFATLGPLLAVLLFLAAIVVAIAYLRFEEIDREREAVTRDVEYAQQRLRLRLLERQEQLMRLAREIDNHAIDTEEFAFQAETLVSQFPELLAITWVDGRRRVLSGYTSPSAPSLDIPGRRCYKLLHPLEIPESPEPRDGGSVLFGKGMSWAS